jgi:hypothetical protein
MVVSVMDAHPRVVNALPLAVRISSPTPRSPAPVVPTAHPFFIGGAA